jgi:hypothetical protein
MNIGARSPLSLIAVVALAVLVVGCGGGSASSATTGSTGGGAKGGLSAQFDGPNGGSKFAAFGEESSAAEREAASAVLERNLAARAVGKWGAQCSTLTLTMIEEFERPSKGGNPSSLCPGELKALAEPLPDTKGARADTLGGPIDAFRVKGSRGYALYHGNDGSDYAMLLAKEDGHWKVAALQGTKIG